MYLRTEHCQAKVKDVLLVVEERLVGAVERQSKGVTGPDVTSAQARHRTRGLRQVLHGICIHRQERILGAAHSR